MSITIYMTNANANKRSGMNFIKSRGMNANKRARTNDKKKTAISTSIVCQPMPNNATSHNCDEHGANSSHCLPENIAHGKRLPFADIYSEAIEKLVKIHKTVANGTPKHYAIAFRRGTTKWWEKVGIRNEQRLL